MSAPLPGQPLDPHPALERWDGRRWKVERGLSGRQGELLAVSCASALRCLVAGYDVEPITGRYRTLLARWAGAAWARMPAPTRGGQPGTALDALDCPASRRCVSAGSYPNRLGVLQPLAERLAHGSWRATLERLSGRASALFTDVACAGAAECWAVGYDLARVRPLISRWTGRAWRVGRSPASASAIGQGLFGVSCLTRADCWAVGWSAYGGGTRALIDHWDGRRWGEVPAGSLRAPTGPPGVDGAGADAYLLGVACGSARECWAVGGVLDQAGALHPLLERWDGASWSVVAPSTALAGINAVLSGAYCRTPDDCWAVGGYEAGTGGGTLTEHWNGSAWTPSLGVNAARAEVLDAVTCPPGGGGCWAVGASSDATGGLQTLIQRERGSSWRTVDAPGAGVLQDVACPRRTRCWAVGTSDPGSSASTLLEVWGRGRWTTATGPRAPRRATASGLTGVTCSAERPGCWAVGYWSSRREVRLLAERR